MTIIIQSQEKPPIHSFSPIQQDIYRALDSSPQPFYYDSAFVLEFELLLREKLIQAAYQLHESKAEFAPFDVSRFNPQIWTKTKYGYVLKPYILPSDAIRDVFQNSHLYAFECSTAIVLLFYKSVLDSISISRFNTLFQGLLVWDWNYDQDLGIDTRIGRDFIPGDVVYFYNPDFQHPIWTGENAVYLGNDRYFGHGVGLESERGMIEALNTLRKPGATQDAYLISQHSRLSYKYLSQFARRAPQQDYHSSIMQLL
ncbi:MULTISPECIES: protein-glutamine gamma-glutamyltransferase [Cytobacillus]|uniref:Protein-glutamine gamma-glutamyltransferase n=1 Tax=Cytobacillus stercorigallinarum TaxID=2762240 RepID=A0ABR8QRF7_9BACI|nr:protein-glutamine gamma-glutamyltransferase [Cytobacillus stercorigallinarum]MBD7938132.1 protein-glutamine gamma-glutamyltransferase [Cytobacillus stercorigallinarum]